jgi:sulfur carrier protein ThiS
MVIKVKGYANMKKYTAHLPSEGNLDVPEGATVDAVFKKLKVPPESKMIIIVNGRHKPGDHILQTGDMLTFFPPLEGG